MENRSHALVAGLFAVLLLAAAAFFVTWLNDDQADYLPYDLVSFDSVQGLTPQADVRYRGLLVGKVRSIGFDADGSGALLIRIGVRPDTPMTDTLKATVEMKGVTGVAYIDLDDDGVHGTPLPSSPGAVARLRMQPGLAERLMNRGAELMERLERAGDQIVTLLGPENQKALQQTLENTARATEQVNALLEQFQPLAQEAVPMIRNVAEAAQQAGAAARDVSGLATQARSTLQSLAGPQGLLGEMTQSMAQIRRASAGLATAVPQLSQAAESVGAAAYSASRTAQSIRHSPQSILFGPPPKRPGPGEPGFDGFSQR